MRLAVPPLTGLTTILGPSAVQGLAPLATVFRPYGTEGRLAGDVP